MTAKTFATLVALHGIEKAAKAAFSHGVCLAQTQLWIRQLHL